MIVKRIQDMKSLQNLKTHRGERRGSIPRNMRSRYLDLYLQQKEKDRLENEVKILEKKTLLNKNKLERTIEQIIETKNEINAMEKEESGQNQNENASIVNPTIRWKKRPGKKQRN